MKTITLRKLTATYGPHARTILRDHLEELPREKGVVRSYKVIKALPTAEQRKPCDNAGE